VTYVKKYRQSIPLPFRIRRSIKRIVIDNKYEYEFTLHRVFDGVKVVLETKDERKAIDKLADLWAEYLDMEI